MDHTHRYLLIDDLNLCSGKERNNWSLNGICWLTFLPGVLKITDDLKNQVKKNGRR